LCVVVWVARGHRFRFICAEVFDPLLGNNLNLDIVPGTFGCDPFVGVSTPTVHLFNIKKASSVKQLKTNLSPRLWSYRNRISAIQYRYKNSLPRFENNIIIW
jgi:hypothetical protein